MLPFLEFWNRIYFSLYSILLYISHYVLGSVLEYLFIRPLYSFPIIRRRLKKNGLTSYKTWIKTADSYYENPRTGQLMYFTNGAITYVLLGLWLLCFNIFYIVFGVSVRTFMFTHLKFIIILITGLSILFCQIVIWHKERYIKYFDQFNKEGLNKRIVWCIGTLAFCIILTVAIYFTFMYAEMKNGFL